MTRTKAALTLIAFSFVVLQIDALRQTLLPASSANLIALSSSAMAGGSCAVPAAERLRGQWRVTAVRCTTAACREAHMAVGDTMTFAQDISGARQFSVNVKGTDQAADKARSEGYTLRSDGIGNTVGPIVLGHNVLDGSPLQLHWLVVKLRAYDADGFGNCAVRGLVAVCAEEPTGNDAQCSDHQHGGMVHVDPM